MREKVLSIGDDFWIEDDSGQKVFKVNGKALRVRKTLVFESPDGVELCKIQERKLRVRDSMEIEGPDGERLAMVKKAMVTPLRERWSAEMGDGTELCVQGNIVDYEYELEHEGAKIAQVSKRWFRVRDTYGIEVAPANRTSSSSPGRSPLTRGQVGESDLDHGPSAAWSSTGGSP